MSFDRIAAFALGDTAVPDAALDMAATLLIDTLGVAAGASGLDAGRIARNHALAYHAAASPESGARLLFDGRMASVPGAAFAAATQIDNLDGHDGFNPTKGHIGCAVVPALFAFAEHRPDLGGRDALVAMALSYELAARAGLALHATVSDYHTSGAWNALGVAALGCRLMGTGPEALRHALGIAEYHGPRSQMMREIANPTMLHDGSGMGALVGAMAALMARDGFEGAPAITVEAAEAAGFWQDLGRVWTICQNYIKPYPICRWAHAAIDAVALLGRRHGFAADDIRSVKVRTFAEAAALFSGLPDTTSQAQYSLAFAVSVQLAHGRIGPEHISGDGLRDARVAALVPRISVAEDRRHSDRFPVGRWSDVTVVLSDGSRLESGDVAARGGPEAPMSSGEIEAKFHHFAGALGKERSAAIWAMRDRLQDPETRFADLAELVCAEAIHD